MSWLLSLGSTRGSQDSAVAVDSVKLISKVVHSRDEWGQLCFLCHSALLHFCTSIVWLCCPLLERSGRLFKHNVIAGASVQSSPGGLFLPRERTGWKASVAVWFSLSSPVLVSPVRLDVSHYYFPSATWLAPSHALMMLFAKWIMWFHTAGWGAKRRGEETGLSSLIIRARPIYRSADMCGRYRWHISICLIFFLLFVDKTYFRRYCV